MISFIKQSGLCIISYLLCHCTEKEVSSMHNAKNIFDEETKIIQTVDEVIDSRQKLQKYSDIMMGNMARFSSNLFEKKLQQCQLLKKHKKIERLLENKNKELLHLSYQKLKESTQKFTKDLTYQKKTGINLLLGSWYKRNKAPADIIQLIIKYLESYNLENCTLLTNLPKKRSLIISKQLRYTKEYYQLPDVFSKFYLKRTLGICNPNVFFLILEKSNQVYYHFQKCKNGKYMIRIGEKHIAYNKDKKTTCYVDIKEVSSSLEKKFYIAEPRWFRSNSLKTKYLIFFRTNGMPLPLYDSDIYISIFD